MTNSIDCKIASYNILNPYHAVKWGTEKGLNEDASLLNKTELKESARGLHWMRYSNWEQRKEGIATNISQADIVCLQEAAKETLKDLSNFLEHKQAAHACHAAAPNPFSKHGTAILYRADVATLMETHNVFFGSGENLRAAVSAIFEINEKLIRVMSVHLKGYNPNEADEEKKEASKKFGYEELETYLEDAEKDRHELNGIVIAGDFNEDPSESESPFYRVGLLERKGYMCDKNFSPTEPGKGRRIDWIFYKPLKTPNESTELASLELETNGNQAEVSDHLITGTKIIWV